MLELYHSTRYSDYEERINSMLLNGIIIQYNNYNNKGYGIYLANHSRYSIHWSYSQHVLICRVIYDEKYVNRYRSEIEYPNWNSEYVITKEDLIYPLYFLEYDVTIPQNEYDNFGYTKHGNFGCEICDKIKDRCDHKFNSYDTKDVVNE